MLRQVFQLGCLLACLLAYMGVAVSGFAQQGHPLTVPERRLGYRSRAPDSTHDRDDMGRERGKIRH